MTGKLLYGTSSWSEKAWEGVFYPEGMPAAEYLAHYATQFSTVEADVTYYRVPSRAMVEGWRRRTPEGFLLAAKFPRSIVHGGESATPDPERLLRREVVGEDVDRFLEAMGELGPKCGPLVLQFPYFNKRAFPGPQPFLERLDAFLGTLPAGHRYAVEVRNRAWIAPALLELLARHRAALVLADLPYLPHPLDLRVDPVTADFGYVRLIGDRRLTEERTKTFDRIVLDRGERLERWAEYLRALLERVPAVFVFANNHFAGFAPETIRDLAARVAHAPRSG